MAKIVRWSDSTWGGDTTTQLEMFDKLKAGYVLQASDVCMCGLRIGVGCHSGCQEICPEEQIDKCINWLNNVNRKALRKYYGRRQWLCSYGLKHRVEENAFAGTIGYVGYICNGALIYAAIRLGLPIRLKRTYFYNQTKERFQLDSPAIYDINVEVKL